MRIIDHMIAEDGIGIGSPTRTSDGFDPNGGEDGGPSRVQDALVIPAMG